MAVSENSGYLILGAFSEASYYLGYCFRVPYFRELPYVLRRHMDPVTGDSRQPESTPSKTGIKYKALSS